MPNMPYMNMNFSDLSQMPPVNEIPQSQKLKKKRTGKAADYERYSGASRYKRQAG